MRKVYCELATGAWDSKQMQYFKQDALIPANNGLAASEMAVMAASLASAARSAPEKPWQAAAMVDRSTSDDSGAEAVCSLRIAARSCISPSAEDAGNPLSAAASANVLHKVLQLASSTFCVRPWRLLAAAHWSTT